MNKPNDKQIGCAASEPQVLESDKLGLEPQPAERTQKHPSLAWAPYLEKAKLVAQDAQLSGDASVIAGLLRAQQERDEARAQVTDLLSVAKGALNDINTSRRHVYTGSAANPDDMTFDAIENTLGPSVRDLKAAIAKAEGRICEEKS